jgi:putative heme-binding domain-containing protein
MHVVADERDYLPDALAMLQTGVHDEHPRVRLEAIRGLSFFNSLEAVDATLAVLDLPLDPPLEYTLEHTLAALEPLWSDAFQQGRMASNGRAQAFITRYLERRRPGLAAKEHLKRMLNPDSSAEARNDGYAALEKLSGNRENGKAVFQRVCTACHRVGETGYEFGPNQSDVGKRLQRREILEAILEPSKKVDPKYVTTTVITTTGKTEIGFVESKTDTSLTLLMAEGKRKTIPADEIDETFETKQSSMPENLASTLAPVEFLDVVEYLVSLK